MKPIKQSFFNQIANEFDNHVRESIPLFDSFILYLHYFILEKFPSASILDICGSTGRLGYDLFLKGFKGKYLNIDGSPKMQEVYKKLSNELDNKNFKFTLGGFMCSWVDESGIKIEEINFNNNEFNITCEVLGFQFFTRDRVKEIQEMKRITKDDGVCVFCEKFTQFDRRLWLENENLKDKFWKSNYFTKSQIEEKRKKVLIDMGDYCYNYNNFITLLHEHFTYVVQVYKAGNFAGFICTDSPNKIPVNINKKLINNKFNFK